MCIFTVHDVTDNLPSIPTNIASQQHFSYTIFLSKITIPFIVHNFIPCNFHTIYLMQFSYTLNILRNIRFYLHGSVLARNTLYLTLHCPRDVAMIWPNKETLIFITSFKWIQVNQTLDKSISLNSSSLSTLYSVT